MKPVLIAKSLTDWHHNTLRDLGFNYEHIDPLTFEYIYNPAALTQYLRRASSIVLTSSKSIRVLEHVDPEIRPSKHLYVVGDRTADLASELGFIDIVSAQDSEALAKQSKWSDNGHILYLCGNLRRDILVEYWSQRRIPFEEVVIYETRPLYPKIDAAKYSAILFFSPSGVWSLTKDNKISKEMTLGSIGPSTTRYLSNLGFQNILEAPERSFPSLLKAVAEHL
jgi:uroporphyrinogen-III synthase